MLPKKPKKNAAVGKSIFVGGLLFWVLKDFKTIPLPELIFVVFAIVFVLFFDRFFDQ